MVRAATWLTHLDVDWQSPVWRHWLQELGDGQRLVRDDERGCGLSDRKADDLSVETWAADLETVVDAAGLDRFSLLGVSQGAVIALVLQRAIRHAWRISEPAPTGKLRIRPITARQKGVGDPAHEEPCEARFLPLRCGTW